MSNTHTVVSNFIWSLLNNSSLFVSSLLLSIVLPNILGHANYGQYTYAIWLFTTIALVCSLGAGQTISKFTAQWVEQDQLVRVGAMLKGFALSQLILLIGIAIIVVAQPHLVSQLLGADTSNLHLSLVVLIALPAVLNIGLVATLQGLHRYRQQAIAASLATLLNVITVILVIVINPTITNLLLAVLANYVLLSLLYIWMARDVIAMSTKLTDIAIKPVAAFAVGAYAISLIDAIVWQRSEVFFLGRLTDSSQVGFYTLAYGLVTTSIFFVMTAFNAVLVPIFTRIKYGNDPAAVSSGFYRVTKLSAMIALPAGVGFAVIAPAFVSVFYDAEFQPIVPLIRILAIAAAVTAIASAASALQFAHHKISFAIKLGLCLAVVNIILDIVLITQFQALGAAWAKTIIQVIGVVLGVGYICWSLRLQFPFADIIRIVLATLVMAILIGGVQWIGLPDYIYLMLALPLGALAYMVGLAGCRVLDKTDLAMLKSIDLSKFGPASNMLTKGLAYMDKIAR